MKVYSIVLEQYRSSMFGGNFPADHIGTYASLDLAKAKMDEVKKQILSNPGMLVEEFSNQYGCVFGISYGHEMGSMSFVPGAYKCTEHEVIE